MKRLATAAVLIPLALAAIYLLPAWGFFALLVALFAICAVEYLAIVRHRTPHTPRWPLLLLVPLAAFGLAVVLQGWVAPSPFQLLAVGVLSTILVPTIVLFAKVPLDESLASLGALGFGIPYLAFTIASLHHLQASDPDLVILVCAIVWMGDTGAYYIGSRWGRHKLAPTISPKKSWEGASAGLVMSLLAAVGWSFWKFGWLDSRVVVIGVAAAIAGQIGDLAESMVKRGAGVKDSGNILPGHGGMLDRMDSLLFAAPTTLVVAWLLGFEVIAAR